MRILVVGAGIAGSAAAYMLAHDGHDVHVVDAAARPHSGGYQILFDRTALRLFDQIGALGVVEDLSTPTATITVARGNRTLATLTTDGYRSARRGDLVGAFSQYAAHAVPMQFGRELVGIEHRKASVSARFADGSSGDYDLVIGADGLNSTVRRLAVEVDQSYVYDNGRMSLWVNVPGRVAGTTHAAILLGDGVGAQVFPYTDQNETLVLTSIHTGTRRYAGRELLPTAARLLQHSGPRYARFAADVLNAREDEIRVTRFAQVRAPRWNARNVVLLGDAAHCIDPLSGAGAHGALLGAAVFAEELRRTPDSVAAAAARYAGRMRPFVRSAQFLTAGLMERATAHGLRQRFAADRSLIAAALTARRGDIPDHCYTDQPATHPHRHPNRIRTEQP